MPKAAMHEDDTLTGWEDKIGLARQLSIVKPVPIPHAVNQAPNCHLRRGVFAGDPAHVF